MSNHVSGGGMNLESPPAFQGAKHDVNGYCVRHSNVRLCQPVFAKDGKDGGVAPIKYKAVRKICPQCGVQFTQNVKKSRRPSHDKELLPHKGSSDASMPSQQITKPLLKKDSSGSNDSPLPRRKHGNKNQKQSIALNSEKEKDRDNKTKKIKKEGGKDRIGERPKERDERGKKDRNVVKKSRPADANKDEVLKHGSPMKDANALQSGTRGRQRLSHGQPKLLNPGKESKHAPDPKQAHDMKKLDSKEVKKQLDDITLTRSPNIPKYTVKFSRRGRQPMNPMPFRKEDRGGNHEQESERATDVFMMAAGLQLHNNDNGKESNDNKEPPRMNSNENKKERRGVKDQLRCSSNSNAEDQTKKAPSTKENNPELNKLWESHDRKVPGKGNREPGKADLSKLWQSHDGINKETTHDRNKHGSSSSNSNAEDQMKKAPSTNEKNPELNKLWESHDRKVPGKGNREPGKADLSKLWQSHDGINKETTHDRNKHGSSSSNSNAEDQTKKAPSTKEKNPELNKLWESHDKKVPGKSNREPGKADLSKLWQSHDGINKETTHDRNKHSSKGMPGTKSKEGPVKKVVFHRAIKVKESKDKPLRGSFSTKEHSKRTDKSSKDQSKVNGSHSDNAARHGGKSRVDGVKEKESHGSSAINQRPSRGRSSNDEKVRFQHGRSHSPQKRKKGDHGDKNIESRRKNHYPRSKSLPQQNERKRVPVEYHVQKMRHCSTLSKYRQEFLEEMAQMTQMSVKNIIIPTEIEPMSQLPSKIPSE
eukprot:CAMPEP_0172330952 /NCGR_PEP_ID=MMETSP1058-20130122/61671_1 /TAXON_ID=83371 /ORGANISM="Detonula confervacea, Strain CCMP 353" /LENGTH=761 /DNA_ID=CAMNT_0013048191 /DNA_START=137 /DNA_END=2422 /DNA_ORIENTATION=-